MRQHSLSVSRSIDVAKRLLKMHAKNNKGLLALLLVSVVLASLYVVNVHMLLYDNWIIYGFVRSIDMYGLRSITELSVYHRFYITYYPVPLWTLSNIFSVDSTVLDLALFSILFPSMVLLTYNLVNAIAGKKVSSFATLLFFFGGGSAWIARLLYTDNYWMASYISLDANFGDSWLVSGLWAYKAFSLFLALSATSLFLKLQWFKDARSTRQSILLNILFIVCASLSVLTHAYGLLFVVGFILIASLYVALLKPKTQPRSFWKTKLGGCSLNAALATLTVVGVDTYFGNPLGRFIEERMLRFFVLDVNAYCSIFLIMLGGFVVSVLLNEIGSVVTSHFPSKEDASSNIEKATIFRLSIGVLISIVSCVVFAGVILWLVRPIPEEYLLTAVVWPLEYTVSRYSLLYILATFTMLVGYRRGYMDVVLANLLGVSLTIIFGTFFPMPVKTRVTIPLKLALVVGVGYGISRVLAKPRVEASQENRRAKRVFAKLRAKATFACLGALLVFSTFSSWYFWFDTIQEVYPIYEVQVSNWILENTPRDMNIRFLVTPEWLTNKSIQMLAAKPNFAPIESDDMGQVIDLLLENVQQYDVVYTVIYKPSIRGTRLDNSLAVLESCDLVLSQYENNAYKVYVTTENFKSILTLAKNFEHPIQAIDLSNLVLHESFDRSNASGICNNAAFVNDSAVIIETNSTLKGGFSAGLWVKVETIGEILYLEFDSGYLRVRTNNPESISFIAYHNEFEEPSFMKIQVKNGGWVQLFVQADGGKFNVYQNGTLALTIEDERVESLVEERMNRIRISDKRWWDRGFQGFADELVLFNSAILYKDIMALYVSFASRLWSAR